MLLPGNLGLLTYCMNIHPTQNLAEVKSALTGPMARVKAAISPDQPFAAGLRFSAEALAELSDPGCRLELRQILTDHDYLPVTVNGFPYGPFHGTRVKEQVYQPDWLHAERLRYTCDLADLMAGLSGPGTFVSLSTVPGAYKSEVAGRGADIARNMLRAAAHLIRLRQTTGVHVALAIEPEPSCFLESIAETVAFFRDHLFSDAAKTWLAAEIGLSPAQADTALREHLGLCYDVCHAAVEYEDAQASLDALHAAGIVIHKLQLSSALRIHRMGPEARLALADFEEPTYLHQVIRKTAQGLQIHADLPAALAQPDTDGEEWRVHFHVPVFIDNLGAFSSTGDMLREILAIHRKNPVSPHLEVETYTWDVLPAELRGASVDQDILRELNWVRERLEL